MIVQHDRQSLFRLGCLAVCVVAFFGCADERTGPMATGTATPGSMPISVETYAAAAAVPREGGTSVSGEPTPPGLPRKIIYNAQVELVVESMNATTESLARLVKENGGYIADTDLVTYSQQQRRATWKVRVPTDRFEGFLAGVGRLGEQQKNHVDSQDVTQEFYDLEARIANKQEEEKRLLKHLADSTGKLEDILAVERELSRVRGEIEQMQGRLRYLANLTALSTVTITATELKDFTPPVSPSFPTQIARTFGTSVEQLADFSKALALMLVAAVPWLPVVALATLPLWWVLRRRRAARLPRTNPQGA